MATGIVPLDGLLHIGITSFNWGIGFLHHNIVMTHITQDDSAGPAITTFIAATCIAIGGTILMWPCVWGFDEYLKSRSAARRRELEAAGEERPEPSPRRQRCRCARQACGSICGCGAWASRCMGVCCAPLKACGSRPVPSRALKVREVGEAGEGRTLQAGTPTVVWRRVALPGGASLADLQAAVLQKLRGGDQHKWKVESLVQVPGRVLLEDDDDVEELVSGDELEVILAHAGNKKDQ